MDYCVHSVHLLYCVILSMISYKARFDVCDESIITTFVEKYCKDEWLYSFEGLDTDNPHCHLYFNSIVKRETIAQWIRRNIGVGNKSYSLRQLDDIDSLYKYIAYCIKDGNYKKRISSELLDKSIAYDAKVKKDKSRKRTTILDQLKGEIGEVYIGSPEEMIDIVVKFYKDQGKLVREFQIVSVCQTLLLYYDTGYENAFKRRILEKIF